MSKSFFPRLAAIVFFALCPGTLRAAYTDADADQIFDSFNQVFYQPQTNNRAYYKSDTAGGHAWFWSQANMMEMVADANDRAPSQARRDQLANLCRGFTSYHGNDWTWNAYNDDLMWACIVFSKAYLATNDATFLSRATANFDVVWNRAWTTDLGGGLFWKELENAELPSTKTKNACVNGPGAIAACLLYDITGNPVYLDKAKSMIAWMDSHLVNSNGSIDDHMELNGTRKNWRFSYNQGTYVGACSALYRITGEQAYLDNAIKATRYMRDSMSTAAGIFSSRNTTGDSGGFNGIGIRWIARMVKDQGLWDEFYPWLKTNADVAWSNRRLVDNLSWADWQAVTPAPPAVLQSFGCYGSVVALQVVPAVDPSFIGGVAGPSAFTVHEAENAVLAGPQVMTANSGFRGSGYVDPGFNIGETTTWTVNAAAAGLHWISFRYANGATTNRPLRVRINGAVVQDLPFGATGGWTSWTFTSGISVPLTAGQNTIQLATTITNAPNVDLLYVSAPPAAAPPGATMLFDGSQQSLAANWKRDENGGVPSWTVAAGAMNVVQAPVRNDISTVTGFRDFKLHLEWLSPPGGQGQDAGNSGVKLQGSYEIQILNTPRGQTPWPGTAGAIYQQKAPASNASLGAGYWQSYDIDFTAARWNGTTKLADAHVTVYWNGVLVHDNVAISSPTEASLAESPGEHPVILQAQSSNASGPVQFRNVWVIPKTNGIYEAEQATLAGPVTGNGNAGYSGTGFADYGTTTGESITWTVEAEKAGNHWFSFHYANGGIGPRPLNLMVNGSVVQQLPFGSSGGWTNWIFGGGITMPLQAGGNTIQLVSTTNNGPNVDYLYVSAPSAPPPSGALALFDGTAASQAAHWVRNQDGGSPNWIVANEALGVVNSPAGNDIFTHLGFKDFQLHLEWLSPPGGSGQDAGNSGVALQRRYEIQILNTPAGSQPSMDGAAAIYQKMAPDRNASTGSGLWQTYDIAFTAARWNGNVKISNARVRVHWNDVLVHDDVEIQQPTGGDMPAESPGFHPLLLSAPANNASGPVQFRNIWVLGESAPVTPAAFWNEWLDLAGIEGGDRQPGHDADGDGLPNLWEYATGGNPMASDAASSGIETRAPTMTLVEDGGGRFAEFTFLRRIDYQQRGLVFAAETSTSLDPNGWTPRTLTLSDTPTPVGDGTIERVHVRLDLPLDGEPRIFIRPRVDLANY